MVRAFIAGIAISVIAPLVGSFLVVKRLSLIADTLSHIALAGVAIGLLTGSFPIVTTIITTIIASVAIEYLRTRKNISADVLLAMFLPGGLSLSIVLLSFAHGFNANLFSYLFGSITTVTVNDLWFILALACITIATVAFFYKQLFFVAFDEESAKVRGIHTGEINLILIVLTAVTVSLAMRIVGILLIGALMVIPVVTGMQIAKSFKQSIYLSFIFACISVTLGLFTSYYANLPAGGAIVLLSLTIFGLIAVFGKK